MFWNVFVSILPPELKAVVGTGDASWELRLELVPSPDTEDRKLW